MAQCLLSHSSHPLHGTSLPAIIRSNWIPCEFAVRAVEESKAWKQEKGAHVFKGCQKKCFSSRKNGQSENSAVEMCFTCRRGSLVAGVAGED